MPPEQSTAFVAPIAEALDRDDLLDDEGQIIDSPANDEPDA
jgi:hypothetical protein